MLNIFKFLKKEIVPATAIFLLLLVQAFCDLALPGYTSDIVNVGISRYGIEDSVPDVITKETFDTTLLFMTEGNANIVKDCFEATTVNSVEAYKIKDINSNKREEINSLIKNALITGYGVKMSGEIPVQMLAMMPEEARLQIVDKTMESIAAMGDTAIDSGVAQVILEEDKVLGIDSTEKQSSYMWSVGFKMMGMALLMMLTSIAVGFLASRIGARVAMNLRLQVFNRVVGYSNAEIDKFSTASLVTRSTNDIQQIQMVTVMMLRIVFYAPILAIGGVLKVNQTKTGLAWLIAAAVGALFVLIGILMVVALPKFKKMQILVDRLNLVAREILTGIPVIRAFSREKHEENRFDEANTNLYKTQLFTQKVMVIMMPAMMLIMNFVSVGIIWFGGKNIDAGQMQVGDMMAFMTYSMQIVISFLMLTMIAIILPRAGVAANRIAEVLNTDTSLLDKDKTVKPSGEGVVVFDNVDFAYPDAKENVLEAITFTAKPGETTAIIGSTGNGKSTLVNLIPRFYDVTGGKITIDGIDLRDMKQSDLRDMIGYVSQKATLFSGTIRSNIAYGIDDEDSDAVITAAKIAQAEEFIESKNNTYDAEIAQGGTNVSGGQKQRLSIARAIAKNPKIYIFDDSFSALDYKTDVALRNALSKYTSNATVFIVAQRISTILHAEQIIVLDDGKVVGKGTHKELMKSCEVYRQIAESQLSSKDLDNLAKEV